MAKFKKERYITPIQNKNGWSFRVRYKGTDKIFNEADYLSASQCFKSAVAYRNRILVAPIFDAGKTVAECYEELASFYVTRAETRRKHDIVFAKYIHHKETPIGKVTRADIIADLNLMVSDCSQDLIRRCLSLWRKIFELAIAKEYVLKDASASIKAPQSLKLKPKKRLELTDEETLETLANYLKKHLQSPLMRKEAEPLLFTLFYTGMRPAELFALDKADIDLKNKTISIQKEIGSDLNRNAVIRPCKTEMSHRVIPVSDKCLPYLDKAMKFKSPVLFPNDKGTYYSTKEVGELFHLHAKKIGIDFHLYQCRHSFITRLFMQGVDIKTIQELCGQNIDATTIGYVVSDEERRKRAVNLM